MIYQKTNKKLKHYMGEKTIPDYQQMLNKFEDNSGPAYYAILKEELIIKPAREKSIMYHIIKEV